MSFITRLACLSLFLLLAVGCGEGGTVITNQGNTNNEQPGNQTETNGQEFPEFSQWTADLLETRCEKIFDCCSSQEREERFGMTADDIPGCMQSERGVFGGMGSVALEVSLHQERIEFDEGMAVMCQQALEQLTCSDFDGSREQRENLPGCKEMVIGLVADGDECSGDWECQDGLFCQIQEGEPHPNDASMDNSRCAPLPGFEQDCPDRRCAFGYYCERFDLICLEIGLEGDSCLRDEECNSNYCREDASQDLICQQRPSVCNG